MSDLLAEWFRHPIVIERFAGVGAIGDLFSPAETVMGFVHDDTKIIAGTGGQQIISSAQVALPAATAYVPVGSRVTLPAQFAAPGQTRSPLVIGSARADGGGQPTPDHITLMLQ
jgi:hypothetical protein